MISLTLLALKAKYFTFYLYMWLKDKPQLEPMVVINLPKKVFFFFLGRKKNLKFGISHLQLVLSYQLSIPVGKIIWWQVSILKRAS